MHLVAERLRLAREVGEAKARSGQPIRNYAVEAEVIRVVRDACERHGIRQELGEDVIKLLIRESLRVQEIDRARLRQREPNAGDRALVIGGLGAMGHWFCEFLDSKGYRVSVADKRETPSTPYPRVPDWPAAARGFDLLLIATPPSAVADVLEQVPADGRGVVMDIASLKSPFIKSLEAAAERGARVTSIHPMWGPRTDLLASKNVIVCDCGDPQANRAARTLFEDTAANLVEMPVDAHDAHMAHTLGLPHAINLLFGHALAQGPFRMQDLANLGGPTFTKQVRVAAEVASENQDLYYEIQKLNAHTPEVYEGVRRALADLEAALASRDAFRSFMKECQAYFGGAQP